MAGWSLALSIFAFVAAGVSAWYARHSALSARDVAQIDKDRRRDERAPVLSAEVEDLRSWFRLWVKVLSNGPVEDVTVEILEPRNVRFTHSQDGVDSWSKPERRGASFGRIDLGERNARRIEWIDDVRPKSIQLRITSRGIAENEIWSCALVVDVPSDKTVRVTTL